MTDRALLELAAKAAGIEIVSCTCSDPRWPFKLPNYGGHWNPLVDDGDALRLAAKCQISFGIGYETGKPRVAYRVVGEFRTIDIDSSGGTRTPPTDITADVRRAIVRAAAEIGARQPDSNPSGDTNA